jgi:hypothetical protein
MNEADNFLWRALEGAFLRYAPLSTVIGAPADFSVADAAGHVAKEAMYMADEQRAINAGVAALRAMGDVAVEKTASLSDKIALAHKMRIMMDQGGEKTAAAEPYKDALYEDIVDTIKTATVGGILEGVSKSPALRDMGKKMLGGAAVGTGVAVPAVAAGSALSDQFTEDARNRALQTAAGVGAMGVAGYGGMKAIDQMAQDRSRDRNYQAMGDYHERMNKMSSVVLGQVLTEEKAAHLATACYLDELLASGEQNEKVAAIRKLNREFIVEELLTKEANVQRLRAALTGSADEIMDPALSSSARFQKYIPRGEAQWGTSRMYDEDLEHFIGTEVGDPGMAKLMQDLRRRAVGQSGLAGSYAGRGTEELLKMEEAAQAANQLLRDQGNLKGLAGLGVGTGLGAGGMALANE